MRRAMLFACVLFLAVGSAQAWTSNTGVHEWMTQILIDKLPCLTYSDSNFNVTDSGWADTPAATDGGTVYVDEENKDWNSGNWIPGDLAHAYFPLPPQGKADQNAEGFWHNVNAPWQMYLLARGLHFLQDVGNPFHSYNQVFCQAYHGAYEGWVHTNWNKVWGYNSFADAYKAGVDFQLSYDSPSKYEAKDQLTRDLAALSRDQMQYICSMGPQWTNNIWATMNLMVLTGEYNAAYVRMGYCN